MKVSAFAKTLVAAVAAGATTLVTVLNDGGLSTTEIVTVVLAVLTALGVYAVPNKSETDDLG